MRKLQLSMAGRRKLRRLIILAIIPCALLLLLIVLVISRGLVRHAVADYTQRYQTANLKAVYKSEYQKLGNPVEYLGAHTLGINSPDCTLDYAHLTVANVWCQMFLNSTTINIGDDGLVRFNQRAYVLEQRLKQNGWQGPSGGAHTMDTASTFMLDYDSFTAGYQSSAIYSKQIGPVYCQLELLAPSAEHFQANYFCTETFDHSYVL